MHINSFLYIFYTVMNNMLKNWYAKQIMSVRPKYEMGQYDTAFGNTGYRNKHA